MVVRGATGEPLRDLVIAVPGIMGTELIMDGKREWGATPHVIGTNLATFGRHLTESLAVPLGVDPTEFTGGGVEAGSVIMGLAAIPGLGGVDLYGTFERTLRSQLGLAHDQLAWFGYDWRLSNRVTGDALVRFIERKVEKWRRDSRFASAGVVLVAHSMGGLVAQRANSQLAGTGLIRHLVTIGTPFKGAPEALITLVNGRQIAYLMDVGAFAQSLPSVYELIPQYECVIQGEFDPRDHERDRQLDQSRGGRLRGDAFLLSTMEQPEFRSRVSAASQFHEDLWKGANDTSANLISFRGIAHDTATFLHVSGERLERVISPQHATRGGDGIVPSDSAVPPPWTRPEVAKFASQRHTTLAASAQIGPELGAALRHTGRLMAERPFAGVSCPDITLASEELTVACSVYDHSGSQLRPPLRLRLERPESTALSAIFPPIATARGCEFRLGRLNPGLYRWTIEGPDGRTNVPDPVSDYLAVIGRNE